MINFTRALGEKEHNQSLSTSEARLTDVELATIHGGCYGGWYGCGGPVYSGVLYGGPIYASPVLYGGLAYGGSCGCPQVIVEQQPALSVAPAPAASIAPTPAPSVTPAPAASTTPPAPAAGATH